MIQYFLNMHSRQKNQKNLRTVFRLEKFFKLCHYEVIREHGFSNTYKTEDRSLFSKQSINRSTVPVVHNRGKWGTISAIVSRASKGLPSYKRGTTEGLISDFGFFQFCVVFIIFESILRKMLFWILKGRRRVFLSNGRLPDYFLFTKWRFLKILKVHLIPYKVLIMLKYTSPSIKRGNENQKYTIFTYI